MPDPHPPSRGRGSRGSLTRQIPNVVQLSRNLHHTVIAGLLIVYYHNLWHKDWSVLITVLGWLFLVKGILMIVFPRFIHHLSELFLGNKGATIFRYLKLILGLLFGYLGFVVRGNT